MCNKHYHEIPEIKHGFFDGYKPNFYFKQSEEPILGFDSVPEEYKRYNCLNYQCGVCNFNIENGFTIIDGAEVSINKSNDNTFQLSVEGDYDYVNGCDNYTYITIDYCPFCGRKLGE